MVLDKDYGLHSLLPIDHSLDILEQYKDKYNYHIITARSSQYTELTRAWLSKHYGSLFASVTCCNEAALSGPRYSKASICQKYNCKLIIDDSIKNAQSCSEVVDLVLLFDWNNSYPYKSLEQLQKLNIQLNNNVTRVMDWKQVGEVLKDFTPKKQQDKSSSNEAIAPQHC
jgi:uncharacterized HAD superfamily protein